MKFGALKWEKLPAPTIESIECSTRIHGPERSLRRPLPTRERFSPLLPGARDHSRFSFHRSEKLSACSCGSPPGMSAGPWWSRDDSSSPIATKMLFWGKDPPAFPQNRYDPMSSPKTAKKTFPLRLDPQMYRALEQWASEEIRSVNGHIEYLLREALIKEKRIKKDGSTT